MNKPPPPFHYFCKYCKKGFLELGLLMTHKKQFHLAEVVQDRQIRKRRVVGGQSGNHVSTSIAFPSPNMAVVRPRAGYLLNRCPPPSLPTAPSPASEPSAPVASANAANDVPASVIAAQKVATTIGGNKLAVSKSTLAVLPTLSISQVSRKTIFPADTLYSTPIPRVYASPPAPSSNNVAASGANPRFSIFPIIIPNVTISPVAVPKVVPPSVFGMSSLPILARKPPVPDVSIFKSVAPTPLPAPRRYNTPGLSTSKGSSWKSVTPPAPVPTGTVASTRAATETGIPTEFPSPSENVESNDREDVRDRKFRKRQWESSANSDDVVTMRGTSHSETEREVPPTSMTRLLRKRPSKINSFPVTPDEAAAAVAATSVTAKQRFTCTHCRNDFSTMWKWVAHMKVHTDVKPLKCSLCSKVMYDQGMMDLHRLGHFQKSGQISVIALPCKEAAAETPPAAFENPSPSPASDAPPQAQSNQVKVIVPNPLFVATSPKPKKPNQGPMMGVPAAPVASSNPALSSVNPENRENTSSEMLRISEMFQSLGINPNQSQDSSSNPHRDSFSSEQEIPAQGKVLNCADSGKTFKYRQSLIKHQNSSHNNLLDPSQDVVKVEADSVVSSSSTAQSWLQKRLHKKI